MKLFIVPTYQQYSLQNSLHSGLTSLQPHWLATLFSMIILLSGLRKPHFKGKELYYKIRLEINNTEGKIQSWRHEATCSYKGRGCSPSGCRQEGWEQLGLGGHARLATCFEKLHMNSLLGPVGKENISWKEPGTSPITMHSGEYLAGKGPCSCACCSALSLSFWVQTSNFLFPKHPSPSNVSWGYAIGPRTVFLLFASV